MNVAVYLSGLVSKHTRLFSSEAPEEHFSEQALGFKLMESSFYVPPRKSASLMKIKILQKINL